MWAVRRYVGCKEVGGWRYMGCKEVGGLEVCGL